MVSLLVGGSDHDLLEERKRPVDVVGFAHGDTGCTSLLGALIAGKVDQVELRCNDLFVLLNSRATFDMHSKDGVRAR